MATKGPIKAFGFAYWAKWNAILLERIREELRPEGERDAKVLAARVAAMEALSGVEQLIRCRPLAAAAPPRRAGRRALPPEMLAKYNK